jgi:hypothetical protein
MPLETQITFHPARNSVQPYFPTDYANQYIFPFDAGCEARARIIPHTAVIIFPVDYEPDYPVTIRDPGDVDANSQFDGGDHPRDVETRRENRESYRNVDTKPGGERQ